MPKSEFPRSKHRVSDPGFRGKVLLDQRAPFQIFAADRRPKIFLPGPELTDPRSRQSREQIKSRTVQRSPVPIDPWSDTKSLLVR